MGEVVCEKRALSSRALWCLWHGLAVAVVGCALDRSPALLASRDGSGQNATVAQPVRTPIAMGTQGAASSPTTSNMAPTGMMPAPVIPQMPAQNGGLQCGGVFCPFAVDPMKPCCTTQTDVDQGSARTAGQCGLDFSATAATFYGTHCWQHDQTGVPDQSCPMLNIQAGLSEPGCCTEQGLCGGLNSTEALGCHYQAGVTPQACGMDAVDPGVTCDPLGIYGVESTVDVWWGGRSGGLVGLTDDGRDKIRVRLMVTIESIDMNNPGPQGELPVHGEVRPCDVVLPAFYSTTLCESYQPIFPVKMWDSPKQPRIQLSGNYGCLHPGCIVTMDAKTQLLGIELNNPEAPWPGPDQTATLPCPSGKGVQCFPDHDGDKQPGVTITMRTDGKAPAGTGCADSGYPYTAPPLNSSPAAIFGGVRRADRLFLGTRIKLGGSGKLADDCNGGIGSGIAQFVESRAWGCYVLPGSADFPGAAAGPNEFCEASQALFLDQNMPIYNVLALGKAPDSKLNVVDKSVSKGPLFSLVRLGKVGDKVSCADVRDAKY